MADPFSGRMHGLSTHVYKMEWSWRWLLNSPSKLPARLRQKNWQWVVKETTAPYVSRILVSGYSWTRRQAGQRASSEYLKIVNLRKLN